MEIATSHNKNTKRDRFERLAVHRTNEVLRKLQILGHCANRSAYEYDEDDVSKIFQEIDRQLRETKAKFYVPAKKRFKL